MVEAKVAAVMVGTDLGADAVLPILKSAQIPVVGHIQLNERAAASVGVNVASAKLIAFALSSFLAGLGGALIGYSRGQLSADSFGVSVSLTLLAFAYLGGITSIGGALVAGSLAPSASAMSSSTAASSWASTTC